MQDFGKWSFCNRALLCFLTIAVSHFVSWMFGISVKLVGSLGGDAGSIPGCSVLSFWANCFSVEGTVWGKSRFPPFLLGWSPKLSKRLTRVFEWSTAKLFVRMLHECLWNIWQGENCCPKQESRFFSMLFWGPKFEDVAFRCFSTCDHQTLHIIVFQRTETESIELNWHLAGWDAGFRKMEFL